MMKVFVNKLKGSITKMYKVIFENSRHEEREIGTAVDMKGAYKIIDKFLDEHNFKSYYKNICEIEKCKTKVDVGSWSEFFYIVDGE